MSLTLVVLSAVLLVCLGLLLGATWTVQALQAKHRRLAQERRKLNTEWSAIRSTRHQSATCPRCASQLPAWDWSAAPTDEEDPSDDDD